MGWRRERDERPPIDVVGAEPGDDGLTTIAVGPSGSGRSKAPYVVALAVAALVGGMVVGGGDGDGDPAAAEDETTTTEREEAERSTSTTRRPRPSTTSTTVSVAPGARIDAPIRILLIGGASGARIVDLHTGDVTPFALSPDTMDAVALPEGVVSVSNGVTFVPFDGTDPMYLGPAQRVITQDHRTVWLISYAQPDGSPRVSLVDISGRVLAGPHPLVSGRVAGSDGAGLVIQAGGRVYRMGTDGVLSELGVGDVVSVSGGGTVVVTCDGGAECRYELWSPGEPPVRLPMEDVMTRLQQNGWVEVAPDGRRAAVTTYEESGPSLVWVDLIAGSATDLTDLVPPGSMTFNGLSSMVWLPGDLGLIAVQRTGVTRIYESDGGGFVVEELLTDGADRALVIPG